MIAQRCVQYVKTRLECEAWIAFGWLSDVALGKDFWKMDPDELCRLVASRTIGLAEFHAWVVLDSGEVIDPVVYPTLAENFRKFAVGAGQCNFLMKNGEPYKVIPGLPLLQYHTQAFCE